MAEHPVKSTPPAPPTPPPLPPPLPVSGASKLQLCPMINPGTFLCRRCLNHDDTSQMEAAKVCERTFNIASLLDDNKVLLSYYNRVLPVLQDGPSCGLAALCMAGQLVNVNGHPKFLSLKEVLESAQTKQYTYRGEMFSASDMCCLIKDILCSKVELLLDGFNQRTKILNHLIKGLPVLVPYDSDLNHHPCCRQGHKAHWAVLTGTLLMTDAKVDIPLDAFTRDTSWPILLHADMNDDSRIDHCSNLQVLEVAKEVYVYAKQGKSCHVSLWNFSDLASSNGNLFELCPLRRTSVEKYVLPDDGVYGGLCNKLILIG